VAGGTSTKVSGSGRRRRVRGERGCRERGYFMCPACIASATMVLASVMSTGGLTALVLKVRANKGAKNSVQHTNPKEETWAK